MSDGARDRASSGQELIHLAPTRILVVDDSPEILGATTRLLESAGYEVFTAETGHDGLRRARETRPEIVLLDLVLPDSDGRDICREMKRDTSLENSFIIFTSGMHTGSEDQADGLESGADGFIVRPVANREFLARVASYVRIHAIEQSRRETEKKTGEFYLNILQGAPALIWRSGADAKCDWFNQTWLDFTGRSMEEEVGDGWVKGVHPEDVDRCVHIYRGAFKARERFEMEYRLRDRNGDFHWILDIGRPFSDFSGIFSGYIGYCFDINERKLTEEQMRDQLDELRRWHEITLGREERILELKAEVNGLLEAAGVPPRYKAVLSQGKN